MLVRCVAKSLSPCALLTQALRSRRYGQQLLLLLHYLRFFSLNLVYLYPRRAIEARETGFREGCGVTGLSTRSLHLAV